MKYLTFFYTLLLTTIFSTTYLYCYDDTRLDQIIFSQYKNAISDLSNIKIPKIDVISSLKYFDQSRILKFDLYKQWNVADNLSSLQELYYENLKKYYAEYLYLIVLEYSLRINVVLNVVSNEIYKRNGVAAFFLQKLSINTYRFGKNYTYVHANLPFEPREELMDVILLAFLFVSYTSDVKVKIGIRDLMNEILEIENERSIRNLIYTLLNQI